MYLADRILVLRNCPTGGKAEDEISLPRPRNYTDPRDFCGCATRSTGSRSYAVKEVPDNGKQRA